jgi:spore coat polysaccharide biosynthesis predicted glycosyltransferase SpsG
MNKQHYYIKRAANVLWRAYKIVVSLKVAQHNNPLDVVILDELEIHLNELRSVITELEVNLLLDDVNAHKLLRQLFLKLVIGIIKLFNIPLSCIQYLRIQILYI